MRGGQRHRQRRHHRAQRRLVVPRPGRPTRRTTVVTGTAAVVLAATGLAVDQTVGHAAATPQQHAASDLVPVTSFVPPGPGWDVATAPVVPATAGTPLSLLTRRTAAGALPKLEADAFNALTLRAYTSAAASVDAQDPGCGITWQVLAGIGRIESDNGRDVGAGGGMTADGTITPSILGPALDGKDGFAAIRDGAGWAHATGPFQFIPSTWQSWGADGNGDGRKDANNMFDASLGAARYLCAGDRQLEDPKQLADAVFSYNHSRQYVQLVLQLVAGYSHESPAALLAQAQLERLPAGTAVPVVAPSPAAGRAVPPKATPKPAKPTATKPKPAPTTTGTTPPPTGPSGSFTVTVEPDGTSLDLAGTDAGADTRAGTVTLTSSWTFALRASASGGTATLVLPATASPSASATPADTTSPSPAPTPTPDSGRGWQVSETWSEGGYDYVLIDEVTTCSAGERCRVAAGPTSVGVSGGRFARATHDLTVSDASTTSGDATATTPLPVSATQVALEARTY